MAPVWKKSHLQSGGLTAGDSLLIQVNMAYTLNMAYTHSMAHSQHGMHSLVIRVQWVCLTEASHTAVHAEG